LRPTPEDEHGRGLQLVALIADRWGTRPTPDGKSVWCALSVSEVDDRDLVASEPMHEARPVGDSVGR
jgi:hypothetical protein